MSAQHLVNTLIAQREAAANEAAQARADALALRDELDTANARIRGLEDRVRTLEPRDREPQRDG